MINYYIICEGNSENNYLTIINRYFRDNNIGKQIIIKTLTGNTDIKNLKNYIKEFSKSKPDAIYVWLDKDILLYNDKQSIITNIEAINKKRNKAKINIKYSYMNFEDFLSMHFDEKCKELQNKLEIQQHFKKPLNSEEYLKIFKEIFKEYKKGDLQKILKEITSNNILMVKTNQNDNKCKFKCDIIELLFKD